MATTSARRRTTPHKPVAATPDAHDFATRPYDLVKEFVLALVAVSLLTTGLAAAFSSPDEPAITMRSWAQAAPADVLATATAELAGTSASATYGPPYNSNAEGQKLLGIPTQKLGGVRIPVDSASLVLQPLAQVSGDPRLRVALARWGAADPTRQKAWATRYADALAKSGGTPPAPAGYGPVPLLASRLPHPGPVRWPRGQPDLVGHLLRRDQTRPLLLLSDGAYLEDTARAQQLGGDQWGMMNETGNYPGQPWMWLYTFWYQVKPFSTSDNADAQVWGLMIVLTAGLMFLPLIPGLRSHPALDPGAPAGLARLLPRPRRRAAAARLGRSPRRGAGRGPATDVGGRASVGSAA